MRANSKMESFLLAGAWWATGGERGNASQQRGSMVPGPSPSHPFKGAEKPNNVKQMYKERSRHDFVSSSRSCSTQGLFLLLWLYFQLEMDCPLTISCR